MLRGQPRKVYNDQKNLMRDALGSTSDQIYQWKLLLEEYGPESVYIEGIHNTIADETPVSIKQLSVISWWKWKQTQNAVRDKHWMAISKHWCELELDINKHEDLNLVFANLI
jgi:hypothetical protein